MQCLKGSHFLATSVCKHSLMAGSCSAQLNSVIYYGAPAHKSKHSSCVHPLSVSERKWKRMSMSTAAAKASSPLLPFRLYKLRASSQDCNVSPVLESDEKSRVQNIFLWLPRVISIKRRKEAESEGRGESRVAWISPAPSTELSNVAVIWRTNATNKVLLNES